MLNIKNTETRVNYYGNNEFSENDITNISQAGGVFVFESYSRNSAWGKVALGFNYSIANDFETQWLAKGNNNYPTWIDDPNDDNIQYLDTDGQYFENYMRL